MSIPASSAESRKGRERALQRVLCIVGPTSSGKTALAMALAKKFGGEIINADARQIYRDLAIGTGRPLDGRRGTYEKQRAFLVQGIPHYLMGFLPSDEIFTLAEWLKKARRAIRGILQRRHLPIIVGGTGLYVSALVDNYSVPEVPPQDAYRKAMEGKSTEELVAILRKLDPLAAKIVDVKNRRRVLRALEVITYTGKPYSAQRQKKPADFDAYLVAPAWSKDELHARIDENVERLIERGWLDEIRRLREANVAWDAPVMSSIGYRELSSYIRGECTLEEAIEKAKRATRQYAKRQMTWFKRDERIHWIHGEDEAASLVKKWLK